MIFFNLLRSIILNAVSIGLIGSLVFSLFGCFPKSKDRPDETNGGNANFAVSAISGSIGGSRNIGDFPFPGEKTYNFKACLIDFSRRTNIPNGKFLIKEVEQEFVTDAQGCLNWPETIKFNYLSDSVWLKMTRTLVAKGLQRGSRPIEFAINPWSHGETLSEVLDLAKQSTPYLLDKDAEISQRLSGKDSSDKTKVRNIWVENGELNVTNGKMSGQSYVWHDQIFLKPQILFAKTDSTPVLVPILHGSFKVEISLISEDVRNQKTQRVVLAQRIVPKVVIANNTLMIDVDFALKQGPTSGQAILGVKLIPLGAPEGLHAFEGVFPLGNFSAFYQSTSLKISESVANQNTKGIFSIKSFLGGNSETPANEGSIQVGTSTLNNNHMAVAGVLAEHFHIKDFKIVRETELKKTLSYSIQTCLRSAVGNIGLANRGFQVEMKGPDGQIIHSRLETSNHEACLYWEPRTQEFDRNECHHYLKTSVRIVNKDLGMDETEVILINPWKEKGVDLREAQDIGQFPQACDPTNPHPRADNYIFLKTIMMQRVSYQPQVLNRSLQISQHGVYQLTMGDSGIIDPSNESSGLVATPKPLPAGKYLLRLAFVRTADPRPDNGYVTHADVIMTAKGANLSGMMEVDIKDLQSTMVRKMVIAQLFPVDMERYKAKEWLPNAPGMEFLISQNTKLVSPVYFANTVVLAAQQAPIYLKSEIEDFPHLADIISNGFKTKIESSTLIQDIVTAGRAAQSAMIKKNAFNEKDAQAWTDWSKQQNLDTFWLGDSSSVETAKRDFEIDGDAKASLQKLVEMKSLDAKWASQFCKILSHKTWKSIIDRKSFWYQVSHLDSQDRFVDTCQALIKNNPNAFIRKSNVYRVLHMAGPGVAKHSMAPISNLTVSSGFGYTTGHTELDGTQSGLSISGGLTGGTFLSGGLGASYGSLHMETDDRNRHSTTDVGTSLSLSVTRWQFDIPIDKYQKCTLLRVNPNVFIYKPTTSRTNPFTFEYNRFFLQNSVDRTNLFKPELANNPLTHGWLICSDQISSDPRTLAENYYLISQNNGDSESFDSLDGANRQFFLPLRGSSDMARFKSVMCSSRAYPDSGEPIDEAASDLSAEISPLIRRLDPAPGIIFEDSDFDPLAPAKKK